MAISRSRFVMCVFGLVILTQPHVALARTTQADKQQVVPPPPPPPDDLVITIDEPRDWSASAPPGTRGITANLRTSIRVAGSARHPLGISEILLNKNRASIAEMPDGSTQFIGYVRVDEKMNSAEITVTTKTGVKLPERRYNITPVEPPPRALTIKPDSAWAAKASAVGFKGRRWAVVVGISQYEDPKISSLRYAGADAKSFYDFLRSPLAGFGGFEAENIRLLLNEQATMKNIRVALFDFLKNATKEDVVYIYFAGHGSPDPERRENLYLLPYDARANGIAGSGFPMEDMNKALGRTQAGNKVLITDACHSGGVTTEGTRGALTINEINEAFQNKLSSSSGVHTVFTASSASETSLEGEDWGGGHGVFTYYLLEALKGAADKDGDGIVDLQEMMDYTTSSVVRATANAQNPMVGKTAYDGSFPVAQILPGVKIAAIDMAEVARAAKDRLITDRADETPWLPPDSLVLIVGAADSLRVRLQTPDKEIVPAAWLTWSSSNPAIAAVSDAGVVTPLAAGMATITAARYSRKVAAIVRVVARPSEVAFTPAASDVQLVLTETVRIGAELLFGTDRWVRDMPPRVTVSDTIALRQQGPLEFIAVREGTTKIAASIGGRTKEWTVTVVAPRVKAKPLPTAVPLNDSLALGAWRVRPDGKALGDAVGVTWRSLDTASAVVRDGRMVTRGIGRARIEATYANSLDTVVTFVLGELLLATNGLNGPSIATVPLAGGKPAFLLPAGTTGSEPALSPKGDKIAFVSNKRLQIIDTDGSNLRRLISDGRSTLRAKLSTYEEHSPTWSHDGTRITFVSSAFGNYEVLSVAVDGTDVQRLTSSVQQERNVAAAPDRPRIVFERVISVENSELVVALPDGSQPQSFTWDLLSAVRASLAKPKLLPGGSELVFVRRLPGRGGESLHLIRLDSSSAKGPTDLVKPVKDHAIVFAVSPDGQYIAYHSVAEWGKTNATIVVIDRLGRPINQFALTAAVEIKGIAWGASPLPTKEK